MLQWRLATGWTTEGWEFSHSRVKNFLFSVSSRLALGPTQPPIQQVWEALSLGVKQQGSEFDHSAPTSAKAKKLRPLHQTPLWYNA
jgi:hypothetical protein